MSKKTAIKEVKVMTGREMVKEYMCPGCMNGSDLTCYEKHNLHSNCAKHCPGTMCFPGGRIMLGMPKGFNKVGETDKPQIWIYETMEEFGGFDIFNIPVWKYFDGRVTMIRGLSPRINRGFLMVVSGDVRKQVDCMELTIENLDNMD